MTSQDTDFIIPSRADSANSVLPKNKKWYRRWWGRLLLVLSLLILVMIVAMGFYVAKTVHLLNTGQITREDLFGSGGGPVDLSKIDTYATDDDPRFGPANAKVVIVEFSDFQCPFCQQVQPVVKKLMSDYGDKILFIYRDFPLESIHPQAVVGALAGECAHEQGKFWEMHDKIFENQAELSPENLKIWALQIGLNSIQFGNCLDSAKYFEEVNQDLQEGIVAGARATPTFFINGRKLEGAIPLITFEQIILAELSR